uniref:Uncharacterized protein n=1 Tax=Anguilla anguilla TaxID=7936 RepID=A0A0E9RDE5_ANGAN
MKADIQEIHYCENLKIFYFYFVFSPKYLLKKKIGKCYI